MHLFLYYDAGDFIRIHLGIIGVAGVEKTNIAFVWLLMLTHGYQDTRRYRCLVSIHNFHNFPCVIQNTTESCRNAREIPSSE